MRRGKGNSGRSHMTSSSSHPESSISHFKSRLSSQSALQASKLQVRWKSITTYALLPRFAIVSLAFNHGLGWLLRLWYDTTRSLGELSKKGPAKITVVETWLGSPTNATPNVSAVIVAHGVPGDAVSDITSRVMQALPGMTYKPVARR